MTSSNNLYLKTPKENLKTKRKGKSLWVIEQVIYHTNESSKKIKTQIVKPVQYTSTPHQSNKRRSE